jgi:hypothetical protein
LKCDFLNFEERIDFLLGIFVGILKFFNEIFLLFGDFLSEFSKGLAQLIFHEIFLFVEDLNEPGLGFLIGHPLLDLLFLLENL